MNKKIKTALISGIGGVTAALIVVYIRDLFGERVFYIVCGGLLVFSLVSIILGRRKNGQKDE